MKNQKNPWLICIGCTLLLFCNVGLTTSSFSVYQPYLIKIIGLSNTQASTVITIRTLCSMLAIPFVQKYIKLCGLRRSLILMTVLAALSFFGFGFANSFISCCIAAAMLGFCYGLGGTVSVSIAIKRSFTSHKTLALGICSAGTGLATIVWPPIATFFISHFSLRAALWFEALFLVAATFIALRLVSPQINTRPAELNQSDINAPRSKNERKRFILVLCAAFFIGAMGNTGWNHLSVLYSTEGADLRTVSRLISLVGLALTMGKVLFGEVADRIGGKRTAITFCSILIMGEILACFAGRLSIPIACASMLFMGMGLPISTVGFSSMAADLSTPGHYPSSLSNFQLSYMVGSFLTGPLPGIIADRFGSYVPAYYALSVFALATLILISCAYSVGRKEAKENA